MNNAECVTVTYSLKRRNFLGANQQRARHRARCGILSSKAMATFAFPSIITLNVGGEIYTASLATLTKDPNSMLGTMFGGRFATQKDPNGNYFIDRDGALFRFVLGFLRNGQLQVPDDFREFDMLISEADFFQMPALRAAVEESRREKSTDTETLTVFGIAKGTLISVSGRLATLLEMLHISEDDDNEDFKVVAYGHQSDRAESRRTGKAEMEMPHRLVKTRSFLQLAEQHGFQIKEQSTEVRLGQGRGDVWWLLQRRVPR